MKKPHRACPVCAAEKVDELHHQRFALPDNHPLPRAYDVVLCATCGFVHADTTGTEAAYDHYYADYSKYSDLRQSGQSGEDAARS